MLARVMERRVRRTVQRLPGWLQRLVEIGALPSDSEELRLRKAVLVAVVDADGDASRSSGS